MVALLIYQDCAIFLTLNDDISDMRIEIEKMTTLNLAGMFMLIHV